MKALVLANKSSGGGRQAERLTATLTNALQAVSLSAEIQIVPAAKLQSAAAAAVAAGCDTVVAAGGDGTIGAVAAALVHSPAALGVLPLGTFNHFARDLGVPLDLTQAAATLAAGQVRTVDVGQVNGHTFVNNASLGVYPAMVVNRELQRKKLGRPKRLAMFVAGLRVLRRRPRIEVRLSMVEENPWCVTPGLFVGNNRYRFDLLAPGTRERLDGGRLTLYTARQATPLRLALWAWKAALGYLESDEHLIVNDVEQCWVESHRHRMAVGIDGEVVRLEPPLHFEILPGALRVIGP